MMRGRSLQVRNERGQALLLAALGMAVFFGFVAMAVDVGLLLRERRNMQNAADAMALAGAAELPLDPAAAVSRAQDWASKNGISSAEIQTIEVRTRDYPDDTLHVSLQRNFDWIFARVLGMTNSDVPANAAAQSGSMHGTVGLTPFGVLENAIPDPPLCTYEDLISASPPAECLATLKYDVFDVGANIGDLDFDGKGGGANEVQEMIRGGNTEPLCSINEDPVANCPTGEPGKDGNSTGQLRSGLNWRLSNTTAECDTIAEVVGPDIDGDTRAEVRTECNPWGGAITGDADGDGGTCDEIVWDGVRRGSCRLIAIPVIQCAGGISDPCLLPPPEADAVNVAFALFWLLPLENNKCKGNACEIKGYFIDAEVKATGLVGAYNPDNSPFNVWKLVE